MEFIETVIGGFNSFISTYVVPTWFLVVALLGTGLFLTLRLGFVQLRRLKHGIEVTSGKYDDPNEPGDVSHFQALTTALSATVGVGNIAGVAVAVHYGGPGALFWMWVTAFFGMAVKYSEVTLALKFRKVEKPEDGKAWLGTVSGGPMYTIENGLGKNWRPLAIFFALGLTCTSFLTGNAVQANTISDLIEAKFGIAPYVTGAITAALVGAIILGGIKRIGKVTSVLAPLMALLYVSGAMIILAMNAGEILPAFGTIFSQAFNPTAGVAGTGAGVFMTTLMVGVQRGLFSNEAGQGSAPIAHAAAQTDEPVSEGVVALLEPFNDTIIICTITGLVLITTNVWAEKHSTELQLNSGDISWRSFDGQSYSDGEAPGILRVENGEPIYDAGAPQFCWHDVPVSGFFVDEELTQPFTGQINFETNTVLTVDGSTFDQPLFGGAVENAAPLTSLAFSKHLGLAGEYIVLLCVALFAVSTAISWSYYGDRCISYVFGNVAILPFKVAFVGFHFLGAVASLDVIWGLGDVALSIVTLPNLVCLLLLSGVIAKSTHDYFERKPWEKHRK
jgi:AGCS family alanine or glycine:cation symporter